MNEVFLPWVSKGLEREPAAPVVVSGPRVGLVVSGSCDLAALERINPQALAFEVPLNRPDFVEFPGLREWAAEKGVLTLGVLNKLPVVLREPGLNVVRVDSIKAAAALMARAMAAYPAVRHWQVCNEVDSTGGMLDVFGLWGPRYAGRYARLVQAVREQAGTRRLSMGLMMADEGEQFCEAFRQAGGVVDQVNLHFYGYWWEDGDLQDQGWYERGKLETKIRALQAFGEVWLTEYNLLAEVATPLYERAKCVFIQRATHDALALGCRAATVYALRSGWRGANVAGLPAEAVVRGLGEVYKG